MKHILLALSLLTSSISFAQSYIVMNTGKILTLDKEGSVFDLNNFLLPYKIKHIGGRFIIDEDRVIRTLDNKGFLYKKDDRKEKAPDNIEVLGNNYFITKRGELHTIDVLGYLFDGKKEKDFKNVTIKGGNFFVAEKKEGRKTYIALYVVNHLGVVIQAKVPGLNFSSITSAGGQYFTTTSGELFTVSHDGFVYSKKDLGRFANEEIKKGGNYFISKGMIYTVSEDGVLLNAGNVDAYGTIRERGSNFFVTQNNEVYTVNSKGIINRPEFLENVSYISQFPRLW